MIRPNDEHILSFLCLVIVVTILLPSKVSGRCFFLFDSRESTSGNFSSPEWPNPYATGLRCTYVFQGEMFQAVRIVFHSFHLEEPYKAGCLADYLDVTTLDVKGVRDFIGRYCGREIRSPIITLHPRLELFLSTNLAVRAQGFVASYSFVHEESIYPPATMHRGREVCGGLLEGKGGRITSPGYPKSFVKGLSCTWLLRARPNHHIFLRVVKLQLQGSIANCRRADLGIHDGYQAMENSRLRSFCGDLDYYRNPAEKVVLSQRNRLVVTFRTGEASDRSTSLAGFLLEWTEVSLTNKGNCSAAGGFWCPYSVHCVGVIKDGGCISSANFCIHPSLVCDGQPNCSPGDNTDEVQCDDIVIMVAGIVVGTCAAVVAVVGAAIVWLRGRGQAQRRRRSRSNSSGEGERFSSMNSIGGTAQPMITSLTSLPPNTSNDISRSDHPSTISWVEVPLPTPPPPPFLSSSHAKNPPSLPSHSPLPLHTSILKIHSPLPPPNSPVPSPLPPSPPPKSPLPSELSRSPSTVRLSSPSPLPSTVRLSSPSPLPSTVRLSSPSPLPVKHIPLSRTSSSKRVSPIGSSDSPSAPPPSPQPDSKSPKKRLSASPSRKMVHSKSMITSAWPNLSPPPTPPPPPISDPMKSPWLAAIRAPPSYSMSKTRRLSEMQDKVHGDSRRKRSSTFSHEELPTSTSDIGNSKSRTASRQSNLQSTSTTSITLESTLSNSYNQAPRNECNHGHQRKHSSPHPSGDSTQKFPNHSSANPQGLVRSRSLPRHRTRVQPSSHGFFDIRSGQYTPHAKRKISYLDNHIKGRESPDTSMCFPCVSSKSSALSKSHNEIMRRDDPDESDLRPFMYHAAHMCPQQWRHKCQCCRRRWHSRVHSTFELRS